MRELDVLLLRYLERDYPEATLAHQHAFEQLLSAQDPEIVDWLAGRGTPEDPQLRHVLQRLLANARH